MIRCGKAKFGHISRSFALNGSATRLKGANNLTKIGSPSLRSAESDRLLRIDDVMEVFNAHLPNQKQTPTT